MAVAKHMGPSHQRFSFVACQRRPARKIEVVEARPNGTTLVYECGHSGEHAQHFTYKVGDAVPCGKCGKIIASELPEFKGWFDASGNAIAKATGEA